jgi:anti-sigma regulatory factor (Ser/Thr protein kinase)
MAITERSKDIEDAILDEVELHPMQVASRVAARFQISRQAVARHVQNLVKEGAIQATGKTRARIYELVKTVDEIFFFEEASKIQEDVVWRQTVYPLVSDVPPNVLDICRHGLTEMVNNVVDHSESDVLKLRVERDARRTSIVVRDEGIGIFNKIQQAFGFDEPREAMIELSKGKFTTDQSRHSGEGIFFTSQAFDLFGILSGGLVYTRTNEDNGWLNELEVAEAVEDQERGGTTVLMRIRHDTTRTIGEVFDRFSDPSTSAFDRTHVPLTLARYEGDELVSRSQAKRILQRFDRFKEVMLDFKGINMIGQAFADEIFRVFVRDHPDVAIVAVNTNREIDQMISRVKSGRLDDDTSPPVRDRG